MRRTAWIAALLLPCALVAAGCAGYTEVTAEARAAYYAKDYDRALALWTEAVDAGVRGDDAPLLLLERGMVYLAAGRYAEAAQDLFTADQRLEILDFSGNPGEVGRYLFSEDSGLYRGPPHEKILAPTLVALAHAALGDDQRARTAANAAYSQIVRFAQLDHGAEFPSPLVYILVGIWAELSGDTQRAYTAYEAACSPQPIPSLAPVLARLLEENARRFGGHWLPKREAGRSRCGEARPLEDGQGELVVVVLNGRAPIRAGTEIELSHNQRGTLMQTSLAHIQADDPQANLIRARELIAEERRLPLAVLTPRPSRFAAGSVKLPGDCALRLEEVLDIERQIVAWDGVTSSARNAAALSRLAIRLAVRVAAYLAVERETKDAFVAFLASALAGAALQAADTPDTRSWTLLPRHVLFQRCVLAVGPQTIEVVMQGEGERKVEQQVEIRSRGVTFAVFVVPD